MFTDYEYRDVEPLCYDDNHVEKVKRAIKERFDEYFECFIETEAGNGLSEIDFAKLRVKFESRTGNKLAGADKSTKFKRIIIESIDEFEHMR